VKNVTIARKTKGRFIFLLVVAIGVAPVVVALAWYANADAWRPASTVNHGNIVSPPRAIATANLPLLDGGTLPGNWFKHEWSLVYTGAPACPTRCKKTLYLTRQIRLALGAKMNRVQRLFIVTGKAKHAEALRRAHPDLTVVSAKGTTGRAFLGQFVGDAGLGDRIYIVDPRGRLMMSYPADADPKGIIADIERLLKYSQLG
jgi:cytochrome oxidase Cu insertion factor (SCO1/SenC/PrrC family)